LIEFKNQAMKKITTLLIALSFNIIIINAQKLELAERYAGYGQLESTNMFVGEEDTITIVGMYVSGSPDVDPSANTVNLPTTSSFAVYMLKYTDSCKYVSHATLLSNTDNIFATASCFDSDGNIYIVGSFKGTVDMDPGAGITDITSIKNSGYVAKYDKNFNLMWVNSFTDANYTYIKDVQVNSQGEVFIGGYYFGTEDLDPSGATVNITHATTASTFLAKYSGGGAYVSHFENFGRGSIFLDIDKNDNLNVVGNFESAYDFDPSGGTTMLTPVNSKETYVAQYTSSLALNFAYTFENSNPITVYKINSDNSSNLIIYGNFEGAQDFDLGAGTQNLSSGADEHSFLYKQSSTGNFSWVREYDWIIPFSLNNFSKKIDFDNDDNVYFGNYFRDSINVDMGVTNKKLYADGQAEALLIKYDSSGNYIGEISFGSTGSLSYATFSTLNVDGYGVIRTEGRMRAVDDFDPSPYDSVSISIYSGSYNGFYAKYNQLRADNVSATSICAGSTINVSYSNPFDLKANNTFTVQLSDSLGNFANATSIGSLSSALSSGTIVATIPNNTTGSAAYRVRVISSSPALTSERNDDDIEVKTIDTSTITNALTVTATESGATYRWLDCDNNNAVISGETAQSFTAIISGNYAVELTKNGCTDTSSCVNISTVGVSENTLANDINIYPNPANNVLNVTLNNFNSDDKIVFYSVVGKVVLSQKITQKNTTINTSKLVNGVYVLSIPTKNITKRVIINK
jgi:hypothetical protein